MDELTELEQAATMMHELFEACTNAGFNEEQAIKILVGMMAANSPQKFMPPQGPNGRIN